MRIGLVAAALCLSIVGLAVADDAKAAIRKDTSIPAGGLGPALQTLAKEYDFQVLYRTEVVGSLRTDGAVGQFTSEEALKQLLKGTGLTYRYLDEKTITIMPASTGSSGAQTSPAANPPASSSDIQNEGTTLSSSGFLLAQATSGPTSGQGGTSVSGQSPQKRGEGSEASLQEVIVTAQRREERLLDTPQAVSVVSAADLEKLAAVQFRDFADTVPGLTFTTAGPGYTQLTLRGLTTGNDISPTVGVYVDDVPIGTSNGGGGGSSFALDMGLFDLDRIEVLRGPQGTLYGASSIGGAFKYITKRPDSTESSTDVTTGISTTYNGGANYFGSLTVNAPVVTDAAAIRATGYYSRDAGYIDNVALDQHDVNRSAVYGGRLELVLTPVSDFTVRVSGMLQDISRDGQGTADYTLAGVPMYGSLAQSRLVPEPFHQQFSLLSADLEYNFGWAQLTAVSGYQSLNTRLDFDWSQLAGLPAAYGGPFNSVTLPEQQAFHIFSQEIRLTSHAPSTVEWVFGLFYTHQSYYDHEMLTPQPDTVLLYDAYEPGLFETYAGFGDLTYHITQKLDVSGGVRYAQNRDNAMTVGGGLFASSTPLVSGTEHVTTYLADARYHFNDSATGYVRYATGYRPGTQNVPAVSPQTGQVISLPPVRPDTVKSYEAGVKAESADRAYSIDAAVYYERWYDIPVQTNFNGIELTVNSANGARVYGAELGLTARPVNPLALTASLAYQNAALRAAEPSIGAGLPGETLPNVPHVTGAVAADYVFSNAGLRPTVGATLRYVSDRDAAFNADASTPRYALPSYAMLDIRAGGWLQSVHVQFYVHNVLDRRGELSAVEGRGLLGLTQVALTEPRTIGVMATTHF